MIEQYIVLKANDTEELQELVRQHLPWGYIPQGGICVVTVNYITVYYQAMYNPKSK